MNRIANVLVRELGLVPGNRVLLRAANSPMMVAAYFAVIKAGGIVVATMPLLRAKELAYPIDEGRDPLALCDVRLADETGEGETASPRCSTASSIGATAPPTALEALMTEAGYDVRRRRYRR